jgi:hypothetical protein
MPHTGGADTVTVMPLRLGRAEGGADMSNSPYVMIVSVVVMFFLMRSIVDR